MTPEEKTLLERTLKLTEENNSLLRSMRRSNRISLIMRVIYWGVIIGLSFGAYYLIQPYFTFLSGLIPGNSASATTSNSTTSNPYSPSSIENAANSLKQLLQQQNP